MSDVKERPIILTAQEVNAVLAGDKTQYRVLSLTDEQVADGYQHCYGVASGEVIFTKEESNESFVRDGYVSVKCPFGKIGDRLWVQEQYRPIESLSASEIRLEYVGGKEIVVKYKNLEDIGASANDDYVSNISKWRNAETMPRWASRLLLEITDIRIERVKDIKLGDAVAEACFKFPDNLRLVLTPLVAFSNCWMEKHGDESWNRNDWVWVIEFKVIKES
ncbi:hypothetical protein SAMN05660405_02667 [Psychrobacter pacificensis]|uniref:Phage-related protein n=1 Tax=Psychrobacter pacificensis TaxID=112002 RepID=A0A1G7B0N9_9GAMM|nr:hypothetical protein [Psychrobacter pacificensis]GLR28983.1 hypothetical protein GCM10007915_12210 [Psychrobacter pacificensis]SDE20417.1 hypothetical protein SAMN05660405_02667 [Psychrobacter pacificensis]